MNAKMPDIQQTQLTASLQIPRDLLINEVPVRPGTAAPSVEEQAPSLGPLEAFQGTFTGPGFNAIFRPQNPRTLTMANGTLVDKNSNNILELNLTTETLSFPKDHPLGAVPNRAAMQGNIVLGGVRYLQAIYDVTTDPKNPTPIHLEPGLWIIIEPTQHPAEAERTVARMASIPHGTAFNAQGRFFTASRPQIDPVYITPFQIGNPSARSQ